MSNMFGGVENTTKSQADTSNEKPAVSKAIEEKRGKGRPKKTLDDMLEHPILSQVDEDILEASVDDLGGGRFKTLSFKSTEEQHKLVRETCHKHGLTLVDLLNIGLHHTRRM